MSEEIEYLRRLDQLIKTTPSPTEIRALEIYFLGSNTTGCDCKLANVVKKLKKYWVTTGMEILIMKDK